MRSHCLYTATLSLLVAVTALATAASGQSPSTEHAAYMELPPEYRQWFRNPDGSCVQCSNGMVGMHINRPEWTFLLWDTPYGPAVHGGSWPGRVADYARQRGMHIFNVTGNDYADTRPWMLWAAQTNRFCAIGAGRLAFSNALRLCARRRAAVESLQQQLAAKDRRIQRGRISPAAPGVRPVGRCAR